MSHRVVSLIITGIAVILLIGATILFDYIPSKKVTEQRESHLSEYTFYIDGHEVDPSLIDIDAYDAKWNDENYICILTRREQFNLHHL